MTFDIYIYPHRDIPSLVAECDREIPIGQSPVRTVGVTTR